jgi:hypothetical protein
MLPLVTKIILELMTYEVMFATISPFLVIYDNKSKAIINLQKLQNQTTYTCLDAYHHPTSPYIILPPFLIFSSYVHL